MRRVFETGRYREMNQEELRQEVRRLEGENARLREWLEPLEAWASNVLWIVKDRHIPSAEVIADGEAVVGEARSALGL